MPRILVVDDEEAIRSGLAEILREEGYEVEERPDAQAALAGLRDELFDLVCTDVRMPGMDGLELLQRIKTESPETEVIVITGFASLQSAVDAVKRGAEDYLAKPFDLDEVRLTVRRALEKKQLRDRQSRLERRVAHLSPGPQLIGKSATFLRALQLLDRVAPTHSTVLILGETGTGKELVARALHDYGKRRNGPFVAVNMAAIPRDLIESELFGHERGAFTGANTRASGRFEQAEGGTLFLDEIGDMPMEAQTRLLRVLQQGEYTTVGGRTPIKTDVRIVAASNKDLRILIQQGLFREDLFFRLNVVPLRLPPLRERIEDLPDLIRHFFSLAEKDGLPPKKLDTLALERLKQHRWPGNVRELENLARRLAALYPQDVITASVIDGELAPPAVTSGGNAPMGVENLGGAVEAYLSSHFSGFPNGVPPPGLYHRILKEIEVPLLTAALAATRGNQIRAADLLGLNRNTLRKKIRDLDIQVYRSGG
jgi:two-component system nitrogen regulation response regulator GlnG